MGRTAARRLISALAGLLALCAVGGGDLFAADTPEPVAPEMNPGAGKTIEGAVQGAVEGVGEKIGDTIGEAIGAETVATIDDAHADSARFIGLFFEKIDRVFGERYVEDRDRKIEVRAGLETTFNDDGKSTDTRVKLGLRVPLPAMKRWFNGYLDFGGDVNELGAVSNPNFSESEKFYSVTAGLIRRFRDDVETGIKLRLFR